MVFYTPKRILDPKKFPDEGINPKENIGLVLSCTHKAIGMKLGAWYRITGGNELIFEVELIDKKENLISQNRISVPNYSLSMIEEKQPKNPENVRAQKPIYN